MKDWLFSLLRQQNAPRILGNVDILDRYTWMQTETVNFYERRMRGEPIVPNWIDPTDFAPQAVE